MKMNAQIFGQIDPRNTPKGKPVLQRDILFFRQNYKINYNSTYLLLEIRANITLTNCCTTASNYVMYGLTCAAVWTSKSVPNLLLYGCNK